MEFYDRVLRAGRYEVLNKVKPIYTDISSADYLILENYTNLALFLLEHQFSCRVFAGTGFPPDQKLYLDNFDKDVHATGIMQTSRQILVKAGSTVSKDNRLPYQKNMGSNDALRQKLIDDGIIEDFKFVEDYKFSSTSAVACVILGQSASGIDAWKPKPGVPRPPRPPKSGQSDDAGKSGGGGGRADLTPLIGKTLYLENTKKGVNATAIVQDAKKILVKAGSRISAANNLPKQKGAKRYGLLRQELIDKGIIADLVFVKDHEFSATSPAASVILGRSASGMVTWEDEAGNDLMTILAPNGEEMQGQSGAASVDEAEAPSDEIINEF